MPLASVYRHQTLDVELLSNYYRSVVELSASNCYRTLINSLLNYRYRINTVDIIKGVILMSVIITGNADPKEAQAYVDYLQEKYQRKLDTLDVQIDGDYADLNYTFSHVPFERIRRITGYLVGTMDNWNDAKTAEEKDRVKHSLGSGTIEDLEQLS